MNSLLSRRASVPGRTCTAGAYQNESKVQRGSIRGATPPHLFFGPAATVPGWLSRSFCPRRLVGGFRVVPWYGPAVYVVLSGVVGPSIVVLVLGSVVILDWLVLTVQFLSHVWWDCGVVLLLVAAY